MRNQARLFAVAMALTASGCSLVVDPKGKDPLNTAEGFCNSVQDVFAKYVVRCEGVDASLVAPEIQQLRIGCQNLGDRAAAGKFGYDRTLAEQCLVNMEQAACGQGIFDLLGGCSLAVPGQVGVGGSCDEAPYGLVSECAGDARCNSRLTCPGFCEAPGALGRPCATVTTPCAAGLACASGLCVAAGTSGSACGAANPPCDSRYFYCSSVAPPTCLSYPATVGADCGSTNYGCGGGLYCRNPSVTVPFYTCQPVPVGPQPLGGDCYRTGDAGCQTGLYCGSPGYTCQPVLAIGSPCTGTDRSACGQPANTCSIAPGASSGLCVRTVGLGGTCKAGNEECAQGLWCDAPALGVNGICRGPSGTGGRCGYPYKLAGTDPYVENADCAPGLYCNTPPLLWAGTCSPWLGAGSPCTGGDACGRPWTGLDCMPTGPGSDCTLVSCACAPNVCTEAVGWLD